MRRRPIRAPKAALAALLAAVVVAAGVAIVSDRAAHGDDPQGTPIVFIVFDEFPTTSLMDERRGIDAGRYPNFAALARDATWFRNATTVHDSTSRAMPAMLDGRLPSEDRMPLYEHHKENLFTLLTPRYRIHSHEEATALCPPALCPNLARRLKRYRRVTPCKVRLVAPRRKPCLGVLRRLNAGRVKRFDMFLQGIEPGGKPSLNVAHVMFPHAPWQYLPSGRRYRRTAKEPIPGLASEVSLPTPWLAQQAHQRHLLQVGYTDVLLGRLLARLRDTGMYDRSLIVVASDHGLSFRQREDRRAATPANVQDIAPVPLFVKEPGQKAGSVSDAWVRNIDVFPTMLRAAGVKVPRGLAARPLTGRRGPHSRGGVRMAMRRGGAQGTVGEILKVRGADFARRQSQVLAEKLRLFGSGDEAGLYRIGPHRELVGRRVRDVVLARPNRVGATVQQTAELARVVPDSGFVPSDITGKILRGGPPSTQRDIAIAVNGRIAAAGRTFNVKLTPGERYSVMIPESTLPAGRDRVEVFEVIVERGVKKLRRLARVH